jgi:hypothetical protein
MVRQETSNQDFGQTNSFVFPDYSTLYESVMDAAFATGPARTIILHLQPIVSLPSGAAPTHEAFRVNPFFNEAPRPAPVERSAGIHKEPRYVNYSAQIKHGPTDIDDGGTPLGRLSTNEVQTTTDIAGEQHLRDALAATIDGRMYKISRGPRPIGWKTAKYLITVWEEIQDVPDGAK